ncbi:MAG: Fic family protein [Candidatus Moranbacteria bacterium]|nr:Fic family protein [Candidatus Moranbacteria bacterium]
MTNLPKFILEKPKDIKDPNNTIKIRLLENEKDGYIFYDFGFSEKDKRYLFWDKVKYKYEEIFKNGDKKLEGFDINLAWKMIKVARNIKSKKTPIRTEGDKFFTYNDLPGLDQFLHETDLYLGGNFSIGDNLDEKTKKRIFLNSLSEEAIASAQLEGAHSSRDAAIKMITEQREPKTKDEIMILNNYKAMMKLESEFAGQKDKKIGLETLLKYHKILTKGAIEDDNLDAIGRLRKKNEIINVVDNEKNYILHISPNISFVRKELKRLIDFVNDDKKYEFVHPVIKAIMIHFWIGYLHPFYDGNGRMARLLFYLYLLKHDYHFFGYYPISLVIKKSQQQYKMSYVYSEQDDEDLTYFIDYNIRKIKQAKKDFEKYIEKISIEQKKKKSRNKRLELKFSLNDRQIELLEYLTKSVGNVMTLSVYVDNNQITKSTGIKDFKVLKKEYLVDNKKVGREVKYFISGKGKRIMS